MSQAGLLRVAQQVLPPTALTKINVQTGTSPVVPAANTITFNGAVVAAGTNPVRTDGTGASTMALEVQISQAIASTDATKIGLSNFDSSKFTVDANGFVSTSGTGIGNTITGNSGGARPPSAGNWNIITANATVTFVGSGATLTQDFNLTNLIMGTKPASIAGGINNVGLGTNVLTALTSGSNNTSIGDSTLSAATTGTNNTAIGGGALQQITTGTDNTCIGFDAGNGLSTSATANIIIGSNAGGALTSSSSNIIIGNNGVSGDQNKIRIGTQGSGSGQQLQTYIAGVINTVSGRVVKITSPGAYPYTTLTTDYVILVDTTSARTINLIASPVTGTTYRIKDNTGNAAANNITVTPAAGNIDGSGSFTMNTNYQSVDLVYNGTQWNKF